VSGRQAVRVSGSMLPRLLRAAAVLALLATAAPAGAQSLFGSRGLGVMVAPSEARAAALGGLGVSLPGVAGSMLNPADAADVNRRGVTAAIQPSSTEIETDEGSDGVDATRFPLVQVSLPVRGRAVLTAGYGAFLDQNWGVTNRTREPLGDDTVTAVDEITSRGGIAQGRLGAAFNVTDDLAIGAAIGLLTGSATRNTFRFFEDDDVGLTPFETEVRTTYTAPLASLGARYRVGSAVLVGGAVTWTGDLSLSEGDGSDADVAMPLQVVAGASARLLEDLLVAVSTRWSGWSATDELDGSTPDDVLEVGGGIEWNGITTTRRAFPVRIGGRWGGQPFGFGTEPVSERALSLGVGARLAGTDETPFALVDLALERGSRGDLGDNGLAETFWRATLSVSLFSQ